MFIRTERLFLRPGWPEDEDEVVEAVGDAVIARRTGVSVLPRSAAEYRASLSRPRDVRLPRFLMYLRQVGGPRLVGGIGLGQCEGEVELSYWIAPRHRGNGYATEAVRAVLAQARALGHRRILAAHLADRAPSAEVLEQSGFRLTGETRTRDGDCDGGNGPVRLYAAVLADKLFDLFGVASQPARA